MGSYDCYEYFLRNYIHTRKKEQIISCNPDRMKELNVLPKEDYSSIGKTFNLCSVIKSGRR